MYVSIERKLSKTACSTSILLIKTHLMYVDVDVMLVIDRNEIVPN